MLDNVFDLKKEPNANGFSAKPLGIPAANGSYVATTDFDVLNNLPGSLSDIKAPTINKNISGDITALIQPPDEKLHIKLTAEEQSTLESLNDSVDKQLIAQFYESYSMPVGLKDVDYRLGPVLNVIPNIHSALPSGVNTAIAKDVTASWRVGINYDTVIDTGLKNSQGNPVKYELTSYAFPPFVPKGVNYINRKVTGSKASVKDYYIAEEKDNGGAVQNNNFDPYNLLYKGNVATVRGLSFKGINDNINTLQVLMNKATGIESTYINEWDLSIYMQEGLIRETDVKVGNDILALPEYVTTLTYGLARDVPTTDKLEDTNATSVDLDKITPWASFNCAVSTRRAIDDITISDPVNIVNYEIRAFPHSCFWTPSNQADNLDFYTYAKKVTMYDYDENGDPQPYEDTETAYSNLNVSRYIDELFAYRKTGLIYTKSSFSGDENKYTPERLHGASLRESKIPLEYIIANSDARDAVLSGWNSTNVAGQKVALGNDYPKANAFSFLPYWKQFFFSEEDGMGDLDQYWQELLGNGKDENSILDVADDIIKIITEENAAFNYFRKASYEQFTLENNDANPNIDPFVQKYEEEDGYGNISIKVLKCKITIPNTKLLNMFVNRGKVTSKAMDASKSQDSALGLPITNAAVNEAKAKKKPDAANPSNGNVNGSNVEAYDIEDDDSLGASLSYADGVNNHSPMLYGGPHGKSYSPQTVEGYCQFHNEPLDTVPTMDAAWAYNYRLNKGPSLTPLESKNFKCGSYMDSKILMGIIERNAAYNLIQKDADPAIAVTYSGSYSGPELYTESGAWEPEFCIGFWKWKTCWRLWMPLRYIFLEARFQNFWPLIDIKGKWECQYWKNRTFTRQRYVTKSMPLSTIIRDFDQPLKMIPTANEVLEARSGAGVTASTVNSYMTIDSNYAREHSGFFENGMYKLGEGALGSTSKKKGESNVRFLIGEDSGTVYKDGYFYNCYYNPESDYSVILQNIYKYAGYSGNISLPTTVSVPVCDASGKVTEIIVGNARVQKSIGYVWATRYVTTYKVAWGWHYNKYHLFWWDWYGHYTWGLYLYPVYKKESYLKQIDVYNLYLYPNEIKYIIPTKGMIPNYSRYNDTWRDKNSNLIINRWGVDPTQTVDHLESYWPFTESFRNSYGRGESTALPGRRWSNTSFSRTLYTKGIIFGDIFQNYVDHNKQVTIRTGSGFRYLYTNYPEDWLEYKHLFDLGFYLYESNTSATQRHTDITCQSLYQVASSTGVKVDTELSNIIKELPSLDGLLNITDLSKPSKRKFGYYKVVDVFDSFIDTITQQIEWLKQARDYFEKNVNDGLIYSTYNDVTDPKIIRINRLAANGTRSSNYYTGSYTEDINYYDALCIAEQLFQKGAYNKNSIATMLSERIIDFQEILKAARTLKDRGTSWENLEDFSKFVSNVKLYCDGAVGIKGYLTSHSYLPESTRNRTYDVIMKESNNLKYDLINNPTAAIWAYVNILYQARKFFVNKRLDKSAGSYWILRSMERVLTFRAAQGKTTGQGALKTTDDSSMAEVTNIPISFIQKRDNAQDLIAREKSDSTPTYTKAVYVKVDYISVGNPVESDKYENGKYKGREFVYVDTAHKYAYKPVDGYYYVTSANINESIKNYINAYNSIITSLEQLTVIDPDVYNKIKDQVITKEEWVEAGDADGFVNGKTLESLNVIDSEFNVSDDGFLKALVKNKLIDYYGDVTNDYIRQLMYKLYIKWDPSGMGIGIDETQASDSSHKFIDYYQYELSQKKSLESQKAFKEGTAENDWFDSVFDYAGEEYGLNEPIKSGITFGVVSSANLDAILSNIPILNNQTVHCLACTIANKSDFWRIEIPLDSKYDIPTDILSKDPVLVSEQAVLELMDKVKGESKPSGETVLMGIGQRLSPIAEFNAETCSAGTQAALGLSPSIKSLGMGTLAEDAEKTFC